MADSTSSESSPISGSYYSDFEASMESEHDERVYESVGEIRPSQFEPPGRMCQCGNCQSMWRKEQNIFCREVDVVKNKNLPDVTVEQLQAEARCVVQHPGFEETGGG
ncbi:hypothetical protein pdam_00024111 [Pocillopora damicornis]|uniref:Uncharacterized protein n=1 Tax=Pocillopora damicornis TaxID=46731 RepID=A0A3M6T875_POCDA|nr:hypothetical protein pdam_00024111 [Pocillopora damicornis]